MSLSFGQKRMINTVFRRENTLMGDGKGLYLMLSSERQGKKLASDPHQCFTDSATAGSPELPGLRDGETALAHQWAYHWPGQSHSERCGNKATC